jgi:thiol-disulfide isomerase/thioredoxin
MSARRLVVISLALVAGVATVAAMVRYSRHVETTLKHASATGAPVKLLRERLPAPLFSAPDLEGRSTSPAGFKGKVILVNFWATWCPPCREEIPDLIALQAKYKDQLQIIGIAQDSGTAAEVKRFADTHGMNYPSVLDSPEIDKLFPPIYALPTTFVIDRDGKIAQKHVGLLNASLADVETRTLSGLNPDAQIEYTDDEDKVRLANAAQANKIPGIDLSVLTPEQRVAALTKLNSDHCTCGCGLTLAQCRLDDPNCSVSLPLAQDVVKKIAKTK